MVIDTFLYNSPILVYSVTESICMVLDEPECYCRRVKDLEHKSEHCFKSMFYTNDQ